MQALANFITQKITEKKVIFDPEKDKVSLNALEYATSGDFIVGLRKEIADEIISHLDPANAIFSLAGPLGSISLDVNLLTIIILCTYFRGMEAGAAQSETSFLEDLYKS